MNPNQSKNSQDENNQSSSGLPNIDAERVANALRFLSHPAVKNATLDRKKNFLLTKGLSAEEIEEAIKQLQSYSTQPSTPTYGTPNTTPFITNTDMPPQSNSLIPNLQSTVPTYSNPYSVSHLPGVVENHGESSWSLVKRWVLPFAAAMGFLGVASHLWNRYLQSKKELEAMRLLSNHPYSINQKSKYPPLQWDYETQPHTLDIHEEPNSPCQHCQGKGYYSKGSTTPTRPYFISSPDSTKKGQNLSSRSTPTGEHTRLSVLDQSRDKYFNQPIQYKVATNSNHLPHEWGSPKQYSNEEILRCIEHQEEELRNLKRIVQASAHNKSQFKQQQNSHVPQIQSLSDSESQMVPVDETQYPESLLSDFHALKKSSASFPFSFDESGLQKQDLNKNLTISALEESKSELQDETRINSHCNDIHPSETAAQFSLKEKLEGEMKEGINDEMAIQKAIDNIVKACTTQKVPHDYQKALGTMQLILMNVSDATKAEKYRRINISTPRFPERFGSAKEEALKLLELVGFVKCDNYYNFNGSDFQKTSLATFLIDKKLGQSEEDQQELVKTDLIKIQENNICTENNSTFSENNGQTIDTLSNSNAVDKCLPNEKDTCMLSAPWQSSVSRSVLEDHINDSN